MSRDSGCGYLQCDEAMQELENGLDDFRVLIVGLGMLVASLIYIYTCLKDGIKEVQHIMRKKGDPRK